MNRRINVALLAGSTLLVGIGFVVGRQAGPGTAHAAPPASSRATALSAAALAKVSPVKAREDRDVYYPNTEDLGRREMRIISCGTGMPNQRPSQAAACFLVELGNGDKFIFDVGTGSADNIAALQIPYDYLDKVFVSHLHADHFGDFDALYVGGLINGRVVPLRVWGPSGPRPELGTQYALEHLRKALSWDVETRKGRLPASGQELEIHEFDYTKENQVVYDSNGVTIRAWPAIHIVDGPVSYSLEWNGFKFVFGGDTYPNQWFVKYAKNADVVIHECFVAVPDAITKMNFPVARALNVCTQIHTAPPAFGKVMSMVKPREAIGYHFFNDPDTLPNVLTGVRSTYDGPLTLADDMMVWNVTKDEIRVREVIYNEDVWSPPMTRKPPPVDRSIMVTETEFLKRQALDLGDLIQKIYDRANQMYGTNEKPDL